MRGIKINQRITDRSDSSLASYMRDISKIPLLSREDEIIITKKAQAGDQEAKELLIVSNLRFVISCAKQYQGKGIPLVDLISEGNLGLIRAIESFDVTKNFKFISYAVWWIRHYILNALNEHSRTIRVPKNQILVVSDLAKVIREFEQENSRPPSIDELSEITEIDTKQISFLQQAINNPMSYDNTFKEDSEFTLLDVIPNANAERSDNSIIRESHKVGLLSLLGNLRDREHDVLIMYFGFFGEPLSLYEISDKFGMTHERTRQIKNEALEKLKTTYLTETKELLL